VKGSVAKSRHHSHYPEPQGDVEPKPATMMSLLSKSVPAFSDVVPAVLIPGAAILAILFGIWTWYRVSAVTVGGTRGAGRPGNGREYLLEEEEQRGEDDVRA
jgi:hypothetical protein